jgi:hypothetical protein
MARHFHTIRNLQKKRYSTQNPVGAGHGLSQFRSIARCCFGRYAQVSQEMWQQLLRDGFKL